MPFSIFVKRIIPINERKSILDLLNACDLNASEIRQGGEIVLIAEPPKNNLLRLKTRLAKLGYIVLEDNRAKIIAKLKGLLEDLIAKDTFDMKLKVSEYIVSHMTYEYHYLSGLFSQLEGVTIERFLIQLKIERIKELIRQGEFKLSELSYKFGYSSPAHLTNQFKKMEGLTPSAYRAKKANTK